MTEVLPFECEHVENCLKNGNIVPEGCSSYCGIYQEKRAQEIERIAVQLRDKVLDHNVSREGIACGGINIEQQCDLMEEWGCA